MGTIKPTEEKKVLIEYTLDVVYDQTTGEGKLKVQGSAVVEIGKEKLLGKVVERDLVVKMERGG